MQGKYTRIGVSPLADMHIILCKSAWGNTRGLAYFRLLYIDGDTLKTWNFRETEKHGERCISVCGSVYFPMGKFTQFGENPHGEIPADRLISVNRHNGNGVFPHAESHLIR